MLKWLRWKVFGRITVELEDWDGTKHVRKAKKVGGDCYLTQRYKSLNTTKVWLMPAGRAVGLSYVVGWRSIYPPFLHLPEGPW